MKTIQDSAYLMFGGTSIVWLICVALNKRTWIKVVTVKAVFFKHTEPQLDPLLGKHRTLWSYCFVFANKSKWQLDVHSGLLAATKLNCPWLFSEDRMSGDDLDIRLITIVAEDGSWWSTFIRMPRWRQQDGYILQVSLTVGDVENIPRCFCQDALKLTQN